MSRVSRDLPAAVAEDGRPRVVLTTMAPLMVTREEAARLCGFKSETSVDRMLQEAGFPAPVRPTGPSGDARWRVADIQQWCAALPR